MKGWQIARKKAIRNIGTAQTLAELEDMKRFGAKAIEAEILKNVVISRIEDPASKRKTQKNLEEKHDCKVSLSSIYRMMDKLFGRIEKVSQVTISDAKTLFDQKIDIMLFDVTTLYFESVVVDELRSFGYS